MASVPGRCTGPVSPDTGHGCAARCPGRRRRQIRHCAVRTIVAPGQPHAGNVRTRPGRGLDAGNDMAPAGRALLHAPERSRGQAARQQEKGSQAMSDHGGMSDGRTGTARSCVAQTLDTASSWRGPGQGMRIERAFRCTGHRSASSRQAEETRTASRAACWHRSGDRPPSGCGSGAPRAWSPDDNSSLIAAIALPFRSSHAYRSNGGNVRPPGTCFPGSHRIGMSTRHSRPPGAFRDELAAPVFEPSALVGAARRVGAVMDQVPAVRSRSFQQPGTGQGGHPKRPKQMFGVARLLPGDR
jgi:hypothetical protein